MKKIKIAGIIVGILFLLGVVSLGTLIITNSASVDRGTSVAGTSLPMSGSGSFGMSMPEKRLSNPLSTGMAEDSMVEYSPVEAPRSEQKIIKNGNLQIKVDRLEESQSRINQIASDNGGNVFSSNIQTNKNYKSGTIVVKVPVANFEKSFEELKGVAALVIRESTSGSDVTREYQDLETRIANLKTEEAAYNTILTNAQRVEDILKITQSISRVRGDIESYQGQLKYLSSQTDMSTISVNLSEDQEITVADSWRPFQVVKDSVNKLVRSLQGFVDFLIRFLIIFLPVAILFIIFGFSIFYIVRATYRKFRKKEPIQP